MAESAEKAKEGKPWAGDREGNFFGSVGRLNLLGGVNCKLSPLG